MASILKSLKLLADATRIRILLLLEHESLSVVELQEILGMGQSRISTQLSALRQEELVASSRSGKNNIYTITAPTALMEVARQAAVEIPETDSDTASLKHILRKRRDKARAYFDSLAGNFGKNYVPGRSWKSLGEALIKVLNYRVVADLGAGEGTLSQLLAQSAEKVIAVDNSKKMVELGQRLAVTNELPNLHYRLGDIESVPISDGSVDLAILSQALHHAHRPERALAEAFRILQPGGKLMILDLLQHNFEKARDHYADVWLGFSEVELAEMMEHAGFIKIHTTIVDREEQSPHFQTLLATAEKPN
ncbi:metalloregulator ArsR/SmtB family transcription factor [Persicirhabdus sediminis]|uniref:Metalloregulator ArsR/SmtB family transcription factor n=1 Tax=Persicirhabdus sediminis TaxID=454144 RepID=A0A8J7MAX2_9BACT|nr:metalloregulator ArsR/SmtB family transcription factor [Persicirhabdus sediminis]MBK1790082.1 metalloregulator ArsR/SmtB family transcription factor [Persicirhabdus sediminis]